MPIPPKPAAQRAKRARLADVVRWIAAHDVDLYVAQSSARAARRACAASLGVKRIGRVTWQRAMQRACDCWQPSGSRTRAKLDESQVQLSMDDWLAVLDRVRSAPEPIRAGGPAAVAMWIRRRHCSAPVGLVRQVWPFVKEEQRATL